MKRYITYLYAYENQKKIKNVGYVKITIRENIAKIELIINNMGKYQGDFPVYYLTGDEKPYGLQIGTVNIKNGCARDAYTTNLSAINDSKYDFEDVIGIRINCHDQKIIASCWNDKAVKNITSSFKTLEKPENIVKEKVCCNKEKMCHQKLVQPEGEKLCNKKPDEICKKIIEPVTIREEKKETKNEQNEQTKLEINYSDIKLPNDVKRIDITEIKILPKKNWYLCNNSFLLHGYITYHYLVIKTEINNGEKTKYIGVPGIREKPEQILAMIFGFNKFEDVKELPNHQIFGFWYTELEM